MRELVSFKVYSHVDRAVVLKLDLADSVFIQSSLKEISNHLNLLCKKYKLGPLLTEAGLSFTGVSGGPHNIPRRTVIPSFAKKCNFSCVHTSLLIY